MKSAKRVVLLAIAVSLLIVAVVLFVIFRFWLPQRAPRAADEPQFVIGDWNGQVAVFEGGEEYPIRVFDVFTAALPAEEQARVLAGIPAQDEDRLSVLLEDYTS